MSRSRHDLTLKPRIAVRLWLVALLALAGCGTPAPTQPMRQETPTAARTAIYNATQTKTAPSPAATATPAATLSTDPSKLAGLTIQFWHPWSGAAGEAIQASVEAFNVTNEYGIRAEAIYKGNFNELYEAVDAALESGDAPALAAGHSYQIARWAAGGGVTDLDPYVADPRWGLSADQQAGFYPVFWEQDLLKGERLGLPAQRSALVMVYNQSWARQLGFEQPPSTPSEFKEQACAAAQANRFDEDAGNDGSGGWAIDTSYSALISWLYAFGSQPVKPDGQGYRFDTAQSEEALAYLKDLLDSGCAFELRGELPTTGFATRRALLATLPLTDLPDLQAELQQAGSADQWTALGFPEKRGKPVISVYGPSYVAFKTSPEEELAAWLLASWLASPEQQAALVAASGSFPTQSGALKYLDNYAAGHPGWSAALKLLPTARAEPGLASWGDVRWVVGDVSTQIYRYYFTPDRIPATLALMDETAAELHNRSE